MQTNRATPETCETELHVTGMHCGSCKVRINAALTRIPGVEQVIVDVPGQRVRVLHAHATTSESLIHAIEAQGYGVRAG